MESNNEKPNNEKIKFDTSGGISVEEQQKIVDSIDSLSVEKGIVPPDGLPANAKKKGFLFPVLVNAAALVVLALGIILLWVAFNRDDQEIREASSVLSVTERRLIQEIRRETNRQLNEKENEINEILSRLAEASEEYQLLQLSFATLTGTQIERADYLLQLQDEYRITLSVLQNERINILEDSRLRELRLRTQAEDRLRELSIQMEQSQAGYTAALEELSKLSSEQDRAAAASAQLGGYYTILENQISIGRYDDALGTIDSMKNYLNSPLFLTSRSLESIKQNQLSALSVLEKNLSAQPTAPVISGSDNSADLLAAAESRIAEQERTIAALTNSGSDQGNIAAAYEQTISELRNTNETQQQTLNERNTAIDTLRRESSVKDNTISDLRQTVTKAEADNDELNRRNAELQTQVEAIRQLLLNQ